MLGLFETILNLSLTGSIVILLITLVRRLLRRIPTKYIYGLWALAAFRLLCPKSPSSVLSLFNYLPKKRISVVSTPSTTARSSTVATSSAKALEHRIQQVTPSSTSTVSFSVKAAGSSAPDIGQILMLLWMLGMAVLAILIVYKTITVYRSTRGTRKISDNVFSGPLITSPFVLGLIKPRIYMPQGLSEKEFSYLLNHEQTHLRRKDMVFKSIWIVALIVHWFNPLVWIAYRLFESDMEMSCDEEVIKNIGSDLRADYCMSLVSFARKSSAPKYLVSSLGFGKENVKARIRNVMKYKKLSQWLSALCMVVVAAIFLCGFLSPVSKKLSAQEKESESESSEMETSETESTDTEITEEISDPTVVSESDDEPLWGTPEWEAQPHAAFGDVPEASMSDGELFELDLPRPNSAILFECAVEKGTVFSSDTLGDFTRCYVVEGQTNPADLIFIVTSKLSETELASYVESLHEFGFVDVISGTQTYSGYTADGCYVIIESYGDIDQYTTIRFSSSTALENDTMGVG